MISALPHFRSLPGLLARLLHENLRAMIGLVAVIAVVTQGAPATNVKPNCLFTDNMVLQREIAAPVWGTADPDGTVTIKIAGQTATAVADADGHWMARLRPLHAPGPYGVRPYKILITVRY